MSKKVKLGAICDFVNGKAFNANDWEESGVPIIRIQNLNDESKPFNYCIKPVEEKYKVKNGDLLFSWSGTPGTSFGAFVWVRGDAYLNQHIFNVKTDSEVVDKRFLYHSLNASIHLMIDQAHGGVGLQHITKKKLEDIEINLPPLEEQKRIAAILDKAESLRRKRAQAIALADDFLRATFLDLFGDPVTNPKGWPVKAFDEVCTSRLGKMLDKGKQGNSNFRPYLRNANVRWFDFELSDVYEMDFSEKDRETFRLTPGDILICEGGEPGRAAIWKGQIEEMYYQKALHRARPKPDVAKGEYIVWLFYMLSKANGFDDHVTSATIAHLTGEKLKAMNVMLPPLTLQEEFNSIASKVSKIVDKQSQALECIKNLRLNP